MRVFEEQEKVTTFTCLGCLRERWVAGVNNLLSEALFAIGVSLIKSLHLYDYNAYKQLAVRRNYHFEF